MDKCKVCTPPKLKLKPGLKILNALFTQPDAWVTLLPRLLGVGTSNLSKFTGSPTEPYVIFRNLTPPPVMSDIVPKGHIIQFGHQDFNYTFEYCTKYPGCVRWFRVDQTLPGFAYPLVDVGGTNITDERRFVVGGYIGYIACQSDVDIRLKVTATFTPNNFYNLVGPFTVNTCGENVIAATKYNTGSNHSLVPEPEFAGLASLLKGLNQLCPLPIDVIGILPFGSTPDLGDQEFPVEGDMTTMQTDIVGDVGGSYLGFHTPVNTGGAPLVTIHGSYNDILLLTKTLFESNSGTYRLDLSIRLTIRQLILENNGRQYAMDQVQSFGPLQVLTKEYGEYNTQVKQCNGSFLQIDASSVSPNNPNDNNFYVTFNTPAGGLRFSTGSEISGEYTISPFLTFFFSVADNASGFISSAEYELATNSDNSGPAIVSLTLLNKGFC